MKYDYGKSKKSLRPLVSQAEVESWLQFVGPMYVPKPVDPAEREARAKTRAIRDRSRMYGLTEEEYFVLVSEATSGCHICHAPISPTSLAIDHDHACCDTLPACGECVRGLLCLRCNLGIQRFEDDPALLRAAAEYLEHSKARVKA